MKFSVRIAMGVLLLVVAFLMALGSVPVNSTTVAVVAGLSGVGLLA